METIRVNASGGYDVAVGAGLLETCGERIAALGCAEKAMIVSDDTVFSLYGKTVRKSLDRAGIACPAFVFPHGERNKNLAVYGELLERMTEERLSRDDLVVALGGGVVGDLAGFAAATYRRGVRCVQLPTTLLAAVDSSVGGKTAVNLPNGKNQVGAFRQPALVICDTDALGTLPDAEYRSGCGEIIKYAMIGSAELFRKLAETPVREQLPGIVSVCVRMKRDLVERDEFDRGERMLLNFGHTLGHAAEALSGYALPHGFAVAAGMAAVTRAAVRKGITGEGTLAALTELLERYGLPTEIPYTADEMKQAILSDKKQSADGYRLIVPERIGNCRIETVPADGLEEWMRLGDVGRPDLALRKDRKEA